MESQNWLAGWLEEEEPYDTHSSDFVKCHIKSRAMHVAVNTR